MQYGRSLNFWNLKSICVDNVHLIEIIYLFEKYLHDHRLKSNKNPHERSYNSQSHNFNIDPHICITGWFKQCLYHYIVVFSITLDFLMLCICCSLYPYSFFLKSNVCILPDVRFSYGVSHLNYQIDFLLVSSVL